MKSCRAFYNISRVVTMAVLFLLFVVPQAAAEDYAKARQRLLRQIATDVRSTSVYLGNERLDERVLTALATVKRHEFVAKPLRPLAYQNRPLPIGYGQTISQPYIVAIMTDLIKPAQGDKVLEIGTGSGYQAAILAELVGQVFSMEIIEPLGNSAAERLIRLGYKNVRVRVGDGYNGWPQEGPFDGIVVTAAASHVPPPLVRQLKNGGRMIIPVGSSFSVQHLVLVEKDQLGVVRTRQLLPVRFVPLVGRGGEKR